MDEVTDVTALQTATDLIERLTEALAEETDDGNCGDCDDLIQEANNWLLAQ